MHPYRTPKRPDSPHDRPSGLDDDLWLWWTLFAFGLIPVMSAVLARAVWGVEPSVGLLVVLIAGRPLVVHYGRTLRRARGD